MFPLFIYKLRNEATGVRVRSLFWLTVSMATWYLRWCSSELQCCTFASSSSQKISSHRLQKYPTTGRTNSAPAPQNTPLKIKVLLHHLFRRFMETSCSLSTRLHVSVLTDRRHDSLRFCDAPCRSRLMLRPLKPDQSADSFRCLNQLKATFLSAVSPTVNEARLIPHARFIFKYKNGNVPLQNIKCHFCEKSTIATSWHFYSKYQPAIESLILQNLLKDFKFSEKRT